MITLTLGQISDAYMTKAIDRFGSFTLPIKQAYKHAKLLKAIRKEFEDFEQQRVVIARKHGTLDSEKNIYHFATPAAVDKYNSELNELRSIEAHLEFDPITLDSLGENVLTGTDLMLLLPLFADG